MSASDEVCAEAAEPSEAWAFSPPEPPAFGAGAPPAFACCWAEPSWEVEEPVSDPAPGACGAEESAWPPVSVPAPEPWSPELLVSPELPESPPGLLPGALSVPGRPPSGFGFGAF